MLRGMQIVIYMYYRYTVNDLHMDVDKYNSGHREETRQTIQQLIPDAQQTKPTKIFDPINESGRNRFSQNKHSDQLLQQPSVPVGRGRITRLRVFGCWFSVVPGCQFCATTQQSFLGFRNPRGNCHFILFSERIPSLHDIVLQSI